MNRSELIEAMALAMCNAEQRALDLPELAGFDEFRLDAEASQYAMLATAALDIAERAILERAAGDDVRSQIKDVLHAYRKDCAEFIHHPGPYADRILAAIRSGGA